MLVTVMILKETQNRAEVLPRYLRTLGSLPSRPYTTKDIAKLSRNY